MLTVLTLNAEQFTQDTAYYFHCAEVCIGFYCPPSITSLALYSTCVGVLVICVLVFNVFCIVCTVFVLFRLCIFILICY